MLAKGPRQSKQLDQRFSVALLSYSRHCYLRYFWFFREAPFLPGGETVACGRAAPAERAGEKEKRPSVDPQVRWPLLVPPDRRRPNGKKLYSAAAFGVAPYLLPRSTRTTYHIQQQLASVQDPHDPKDSERACRETVGAS